MKKPEIFISCLLMARTDKKEPTIQLTQLRFITVLLYLKKVVLSMTNEHLAEFIQQGGNDELIQILWNNVKKIVYMLSDKIYKEYSKRTV